MFVSNNHGRETAGRHKGSIQGHGGDGRGGYGADTEAQLIADCQIFILKTAHLRASIASAAAADLDVLDHSRALTQVDDLNRELQEYARRIAGTPAIGERGLQCKRALVGLLLHHQDDDPVPICDTLLLSLLADVEGMFASSEAESTSDADDHLCRSNRLVGVGATCLAQIEEVVAGCTRVAAIPPSNEQEHYSVQVFAHLQETRGLILGLARMAADSPLAILMKGRVLQRLMAAAGADVHHQRLALARSLITDVATLGPTVEIDNGALRIGGHWLTGLASRFRRPRGSLSLR